jgi:hypothetical protein
VSSIDRTRELGPWSRKLGLSAVLNRSGFIQPGVSRAQAIGNCEALTMSRPSERKNRAESEKVRIIFDTV